MAFHTDVGPLPASPGAPLRLADENALPEVQDLRAVRSLIVRHLAARTNPHPLPPRPAHLSNLIQLPCGDIEKIEVLSGSPGSIELRLIPSPVFPGRNRAEWLAISSQIIREHIASHLEPFANGRIGLRRSSPSYDPRRLESAAEVLVPHGAMYCRACHVTLHFEALKMQFLCLEVSGGVTRWGDRIIRTEQYLQNRLGFPVHIIPSDPPDEPRRARVSECLSASPRLKRGRARFLRENDDPKPKLLHHPVDLREFSWWAYDMPNTGRREDIQAIVHTPAGPYLLVAFPAPLWSDRFHRDTHCRVFFCGALVSPDGTLQRMRVGEGLTSEPMLVDRETLKTPALAARWSMFLSEMRASLKRRLYDGENHRLTMPSAESIVQAATESAQDILVSCLKTRAAPFLATHRFHEERMVKFVRGDELIVGEHTVPLKARQRGGLFNQEQLKRALALRAPLMPDGR